MQTVDEGKRGTLFEAEAWAASFTHFVSFGQDICRTLKTGDVGHVVTKIEKLLDDRRLLALHRQVIASCFFCMCYSYGSMQYSYVLCFCFVLFFSLAPFQFNVYGITL